MQTLGDLLAGKPGILPLHEVYGDETSRDPFPLQAFVTGPMSTVDAWTSWLMLRDAIPMEKRTCIVVTESSPILRGGWEKCVRRCHRMGDAFKKKKSPVEPENTLLDDYLSRFDARHVMRNFGVTAEGPDVPLDEMDPGLFDLLDASDKPVVPFPPVRATRPVGMTASEIMVLQLYMPRSNQGLREIAWPFVYARNEGTARVLMLDAPSWQAPSILGWKLNEREHKDRWPFFKRWKERYGFELVALCRARLEAFAPKPPRSFTQVQRATKELAQICPDMQDDGPVSLLSEVLGHAWRLWWD